MNEHILTINGFEWDYNKLDNHGMFGSSVFSNSFKYATNYNDNTYLKLYDGNLFNNLNLDKQIEILKTFYPIGETFHWIQPNPSLPSSKEYFSEYNCIIQSYVLVENVYSSDVNWFNLLMKNINNPYYNGIFSIHIGFLVPSKSFMRESKIKNILEI
jgi:hypothetical protein